MLTIGKSKNETIHVCYSYIWKKYACLVTGVNENGGVDTVSFTLYLDDDFKMKNTEEELQIHKKEIDRQLTKFKLREMYNKTHS